MQLAQYAATVANDGKRVSPHVVEGIYDNNDQGGLGQLKKSDRNQGAQSGPYLSGGHGFDQARVLPGCNGTSGLTTGKTVGQGASVPLVPRLVQPKPQSMEANKPLILMWWRMHHRIIQRLR